MELIQKDRDTLLYTSRPVMKLLAILTLAGGAFLAPFPLLAALLDRKDIGAGNLLAGLIIFSAFFLSAAIMYGYINEIEFKRSGNQIKVKKTKGWYFHKKAIMHDISEFASLNIYIYTDIVVKNNPGPVYRSVPMNDGKLYGRFVKNKITLYLKGKTENRNLTIIPSEEFTLIDRYKETALKIANFTRLPIITEKNMDDYQVAKKLHNF